MEYNFDEIIDRRHTNSAKFDEMDALFGSDVMHLGVADMDYRSPEPILNAMQKIVKKGVFGYTILPDNYQDLVCQWMLRRYHEKIDPEWVVFSPRINMALNMVVETFTNPGDGIVLHTPAYTALQNAIEKYDRKMIESSLVLENGRYRMDFKQLREALDDNLKKGIHTSLMLLCNPHNPTGRVWNKGELDEIASICKDYNLMLVADEIHADFAFQGKHQVFANLKKEYEEMTIACTSPSKTFNLAGLQTSNIFIPNQKLKNAFKKQLDAAGYSQLNAAGLVACEAAYRDGEEWYQTMKKYVAGNIAFTKEFVEKNLPGVNMVEHEGTYLVWLDFNGLGLCAQELEDLIVHKAKLWLDSGRIFGKCGRGFQRINVACPRSTLKEALERIAKVLPAETVKFAS
mgnify:CR=1 FL=1